MTKHLFIFDGAINDKSIGVGNENGETSGTKCGGLTGRGNGVVNEEVLAAKTGSVSKARYPRPDPSLTTPKKQTNVSGTGDKRSPKLFSTSLKE
ncbi:hypothetical protein V6N11_070253 [Hibiscus sabdariffa]|uniref:Uncharacterized protein n=1 Tax=Hibiscus sabdariffa TaxID=183260 RepID=A0ABR2QEV8_9ROSI